MKKEDIIKIMLDTIGEPDSFEFLNDYLDFTLEYSRVYCDTEYSENHHILPRSMFKSYEHESWNIVKLIYADHIFAHELLANAYINRSTLRPLNFMKSNIDKDSKLISKAAKKGWNKLKNDPVKYKKWCDTRSNYMKSLSSKEQSRRSKKGWDNLSNFDYINRCLINKNNWTEDRKAKKSAQMIEYFKNNPNEMFNRSTKMWNNMDPIKKKQFNNKMNLINKDINKRNKASNSLKEKWKDLDFKKKMNTRKSSKRKILAISPTGETIEFNGLDSMIKQYGFNRNLIDKYRNTGKPVESKNVKNKESIANTIGWKFNYIKYGETNIA